MKLIFVRHGEPDYTIDSLTEKGWREAAILSERIAKMKVDEFYVSPLGRAKDTARDSLKKMNRTAETLDWLKEFDVPVINEETNEPYVVPWDQLPGNWTKEENNFHKDLWSTTKVLSTGKVKEEAEKVFAELDRFLSAHGYDREGNYYRVTKANEDTIVFFCHFGLTCLVIGHLLGISPMVLWHGFCAAPTSLTTLVTEERREGIAFFRMTGYGDISHLYCAGEEPSFQARFCEVYSNRNQRHD